MRNPIRTVFSLRLLALPKHSLFPCAIPLSTPFFSLSLFLSFFFFPVCGACVLPSLPRLKLTLLGLTQTYVRAESRLVWGKSGSLCFSLSRGGGGGGGFFSLFWEMVLKSKQ